MVILKKGDDGYVEMSDGTEGDEETEIVNGDDDVDAVEIDEEDDA